MKMKKKLIGILLSFSIIIALMPAASADDIQPLTLTNNNGTLTAAYDGANGGTGDILILAEYDLSGVLRSMQSTAAQKGGKLTAQKQNGRIYKAYAMNLETMKPLCESAFYGEDAYEGTAEVPYIEGAVADATTTAIREYTDARLLVEELMDLDLDAVDGNATKLSEYLTKVNDAIAAYDDVMKSAAVLYSVAEKSAETQNTELASMEDTGISVMATNAEQLHWAEELTKKYDAIKGANKLKQLGEMLGCDAREAYQQLVAAQDILRGKYLGDAKAADNWIKGLTVVKTGCKVALVVGSGAGIYYAGGATVAGAAGFLLSSTDAAIDVGKTTATLIYGDDSEVVGRMDKIFAPISTASTIFSILTLGSASDAEKIACLGDIKVWADEKLGCGTEELTFNMFGGKLMMDILTNGMTKENFNKLLDDPAMIGSNALDKLAGAKDLFDDGRMAITFSTLADILDEGGVIKKGSDQDEYDALFDSFEDVASDALAQKKSEETGDDIEYHEDIRTAPDYKSVTQYYKNKNGDYVGTYMRYYNNVLVALEQYDDNGKMLYSTSYDYPSGRISHYHSYTNGWELGSVRTDTQYYFEDDEVAKLPEGISEQPHYVEQWIYVPYYNDKGEPDGKTNVRYYGDHYTYSINGVMLEHHFGGGGEWTGSEYYNKDGESECTVTSNGDGTYTTNDYFTENYTDLPFDTKGHIKRSQTYNYYDHGYSYYQFRYGISDPVSSEVWTPQTEYENIKDPESGNNIGYFKLYGYKHTGKDIAEFFEELVREGPYYY